MLMNAVMLQLPGVMRMPVATTQWEDTIVPVTLTMKEMDLSAVNFTQKNGANSKVNFARINHTKNIISVVPLSQCMVLLVQIFTTAFAIYHC